MRAGGKPPNPFMSILDQFDIYILGDSLEVPGSILGELDFFNNPKSSSVEFLGALT